MKKELSDLGTTCLRRLATGLPVLALAACASLTQPLAGGVFDVTTGHAVSDAVVVATWSDNPQQEDADYVDLSRHCAHVESAWTDAHGHFRLAGAPTGEQADKNYRGRFLEVFRTGYEWVQFGDGVSHDLSVVLYPAKVVEGRFAWLSRQFTFLLSQRCGIDDGSNKNLYRLHVRQLAELRSLASTPSEEAQWRYFEAAAKLDLVNHTRPTRLEDDPILGRVPVNVDPNDAFKAEDVLQ